VEGLEPDMQQPAIVLNSLAGLVWIAAFSRFSVLYGRYVLRSEVRAERQIYPTIAVLTKIWRGD
jgi:hypothetical protein